MVNLKCFGFINSKFWIFDQDKCHLYSHSKSRSAIKENTCCISLMSFKLNDSSLFTDRESRTTTISSRGQNKIVNIWHLVWMFFHITSYPYPKYSSLGLICRSNICIFPSCDNDLYLNLIKSKDFDKWFPRWPRYLHYEEQWNANFLEHK